MSTRWVKLISNVDNEESCLQTEKLFTFQMKQLCQDHEHKL